MHDARLWVKRRVYARRAVDLEAEIDALYRGPRDAFIADRNALARTLRNAGRPGDSQRVAALLKPSVSAWAVNRLWWEHRDDYDALHAAGAQLLELARSGASIAGQQANETRRKAVATLLGHAKTSLARAGHATSNTTLRKITQSLEASSAGGSFALEGPRLGRLHTELQPPGFGSVARFTAEAPAVPVQPSEAASRLRQAQLESDRAQRELDDARSVLLAAQRSRTDASAAFERARQTLREADVAHEEAVARAHDALEVAATKTAALAKAQAAVERS